jgi:hypothetical protein
VLFGGIAGGILQLVKEKRLKLNNLKRFVLDECDQMLDSSVSPGTNCSVWVFRLGLGFQTSLRLSDLLEGFKLAVVCVRSRRGSGGDLRCVRGSLSAV